MGAVWVWASFKFTIEFVNLTIEFVSNLQSNLSSKLPIDIGQAVWVWADRGGGLLVFWALVVLQLHREI